MSNYLAVAPGGSSIADPLGEHTEFGKLFSLCPQDVDQYFANQITIFCQLCKKYSDKKAKLERLKIYHEHKLVPKNILSASAVIALEGDNIEKEGRMYLQRCINCLEQSLNTAEYKDLRTFINPEVRVAMFLNEYFQPTRNMSPAEYRTKFEIYHRQKLWDYMVVKATNFNEEERSPGLSKMRRHARLSRKKALAYVKKITERKEVTSMNVETSSAASLRVLLDNFEKSFEHRVRQEVARILSKHAKLGNPSQSQKNKNGSRNSGSSSKQQKTNHANSRNGQALKKPQTNSKKNACSMASEKSPVNPDDTTVFKKKCRRLPRRKRGSRWPQVSTSTSIMTS